MLFRGLLSPHKFGQRLSVPRERLSHAKAQRAQSIMFFCSYVKKRCTQSTEIHRINSAYFCASLRRLREANNTPQGFCGFREFRVRPLPALVQISAHSWFRNYEKIRANTWLIFCVVPCLPCEITSRRPLRHFAPLREKSLHTETHRISSAYFCASLRAWDK